MAPAGDMAGGGEGAQAEREETGEKKTMVPRPFGLHPAEMRARRGEGAAPSDTASSQALSSAPKPLVKPAKPAGKRGKTGGLGNLQALLRK